MNVGFQKQKLTVRLFWVDGVDDAFAPGMTVVERRDKLAIKW